MNNCLNRTVLSRDIIGQEKGDMTAVWRQAGQRPGVSILGYLARWP